VVRGVRGGVVRRMRGSLRAKFILAIAALIVALMGTVTVIVNRQQHAALLEQARLRAVTLARGLAAVSEGYLLSYNFIQLEQVMESVRDDEEDVAYAITHRRDGQVAVYSGRSDLQGKQLDDPVTKRALEATEPLVQEVVIPRTGERGYDVAIPIYMPSSSQKWGTVRLGFSLERAYRSISQTRRVLLVVSLLAMACGVFLAAYMATRIVRPIGQLVAGAHEFAKGSYDHAIHVDSKDEIGYLASAFNQLGTSLQLHVAFLEEEKRRLEDANHRLREAQEQLIQSERLATVGKLAAKVAHEVNNPLAIIKTAIRIIKGQTEGDEVMRDNFTEIEEEIARIARIVRGLLDLSRPAPAAEIVDVNRLVQGLERLLGPNLREKDIALAVSMDPTRPSVRISADQLKQVILNLVRNAADAMPGGGSVSIETARHGTHVEIRVADDGCGIPEENLKRIFDPFFSTKGHEQGMGLGLSVSHGIIQAAKGTMVVDSVVDRGTTFRVSLPAVEAEDAPVEATEQVPEVSVHG
jgi:two-component system NtrC family sensor kinase